MQEISIKIPRERIGPLVGKSGSIKRKLEELSGAKIEVNSSTGEVIIRFDEVKDPLMPQKILQVVRAIGRGFNPEIAMKLLDDEYTMEVIDLRRYVGDSKNQMMTKKGRVIGEKGKAKKYIEERTNTHISVYGHTISIIGKYYDIIPAKEAVEALLQGARHSTAYKRMEKAMAMMKDLSLMELSLKRREKFEERED
ncbi:MAG: KH domain-containing protein [Candidatus Methanodesulfokora washburnensis]|uniref:KH domain-containing protein n=1 Tax=Candidatus Methanodesulfokora washburnensis TaxID=2478471 RepID=UPI001F431525|nr:KH domain-containing protein [Candidatus Methanodesulfokores washburnensis]